MRRSFTANSDINVMLVGVGLHGLSISEKLLRDGYNLLACVDPGKKAGQPLSKFAAVKRADKIQIFATSEEAIHHFGATADIAIITAAVEREKLAAIANEYLAAGINVITLHQDFFQKGEWFDGLDKTARRTGTSFLATGVQDTWWVQLPNLMAASTTNLTQIDFFSVVDLDSLSEEVGHEVGAGVSGADFEKHANTMLEYPPVMGGPIEECARKMGLIITNRTRSIEPVFDEKNRDWKAGNSTIIAGMTIGMIEKTSYETAQGITLNGSISARLLNDGEVSHDAMQLRGDPDLYLEFTPFPGEQITNAALLNRIHDVVDALPGVHFVADMPPAQYQLASR